MYFLSEIQNLVLLQRFYFKGKAEAGTLATAFQAWKNITSNIVLNSASKIFCAEVLSKPMQCSNVVLFNCLVLG